MSTSLKTRATRKIILVVSPYPWLGQHQFSLACSSSCEGDRHMSQYNYLFGQLSSWSRKKSELIRASCAELCHFLTSAAPAGDMGKHIQYSFACCSGCEGGRHITLCNYLFCQLSSCSRQKKGVDPTFLRRDMPVLTSAPHIRLCLICIFTLKLQKIGDTLFLVLLWVITMSSFMVISESNFLGPHSLVCRKGCGHFPEKNWFLEMGSSKSCF